MTKLLCDIEIELKHETEKAYLVVSTDTGEEAWIPKSRCELELKNDQVSGILTLLRSLAVQKRLV